VSCASYPATHAVIKTIGTMDAHAIRAAAGRAIELIDGSVTRVGAIRTRVVKGEKTSIVDAALATALWKRLRLDSRARSTWIKKGPRTLEIALRWLGNLRKILDGGELWFTCLDGGADCKDGWAWVFSHDPVDGPTHVRAEVSQEGHTWNSRNGGAIDQMREPTVFERKVVEEELLKETGVRARPE
jgi:hypothetical protein